MAESTVKIKLPSQFPIPVYIWKGLILGVCLFVGCDCIFTLLSKQKLLSLR